MARMGRKNKQKMKYSLFLDKIPVYATDVDGNILYDNDGNPIETGDLQNGYGEPVDFMASIAFAGGEAEAVAFGVSVGDYDSKMVLLKDKIPITETSIIFKESEPEYNTNGSVKEKSADFRVYRKAEGLVYTTYLLKRVNK